MTAPWCTRGGGKTLVLQGHHLGPLVFRIELHLVAAIHAVRRLRGAPVVEAPLALQVHHYSTSIPLVVRAKLLFVAAFHAE